MRLAVFTASPPEVVQEPLPADHAGDDRSRADPDAQLEPQMPDLADRAHRCLHVQRHPGERVCMVRPG
jgi:hypothetical protein